jgi:aminoglycoside 6'-N-acetyltransferase I
LSTRYGLEIRAAGAADAPGVAELLASAGLGLPPREIAARLEDGRAFAGTVLLALEWGPPSGIVSLHWFRPFLQAQPAAQIDLLLVSPDARRRGVGRLLVKAAAQAARNAGCDMLLVAAGERPDLLAFCRSSGFELSGSLLSRGLRKRPG